MRNTAVITPASIPDNGGSINPKTLHNNQNNNGHHNHHHNHHGNGIHQIQSQNKILDERQHIEREIEVLRHRLELLANRALYASRLQQISEIPDDIKSQSPKNISSHSTERGFDIHNRKIKLNLTSSLSTGNAKIYDISSGRQNEGSIDEGSARSIPESNHSNPLSLSLNRTTLGYPKSYVEIEHFQAMKSSHSDNEVKPVSVHSESCDEGVSPNHNSIVNTALPKLSGRYEPNSIFWATPEEDVNEKADSDLDEITDV